ncbi:MAG: hypothetical protein ABFS86_09765 [Planctomycetota bacterium]
MPRILIVIVVFAFLAGAATAGDPKAEALKLIDQGKAALEADKAQEAIESLQKAIGIIQKTMATGFAAFLPELGAEWEAAKPETSSGSWGTGENSFQWTQLQQRYTRKSDKLSVSVTMTSWPQLVTAWRTAMEQFKNPMMREMMSKDPDQKTEFIDTDGWVGMLQTMKGKSSKCTAVHGKVAVVIEFREDDMALLKKIWDGVDRKGMAAAVK